MQEAALPIKPDNYSKAMRLLTQGDDTLSHLESEVVEQISQFSPVKAEGVTCQSRYVEKGLELPVRSAMQSGEMQIYPEEVCIYHPTFQF